MLAIINGTIREAVFIPVLGKAPGLILSGVLLSVAILAVAYFALPWLGRAPVTGYFAIGFGWLCLTLTFELTFGRLIQIKPWSQVLEAYTFKDGNIWSIVLFIIIVAPYVAAKFRGWA
ncbi:MAG: hypothetical protein WCZ18_02960 [Ottowia sp.]|nr:hypothetical protein [Ottowia sp.]